MENGLLIDDLPINRQFSIATLNYRRVHTMESLKSGWSGHFWTMEVARFFFLCLGVNNIIQRLEQIYIYKYIIIILYIRISITDITTLFKQNIPSAHCFHRNLVVFIFEKHHHLRTEKYSIVP